MMMATGKKCEESRNQGDALPTECVASRPGLDETNLDFNLTTSPILSLRGSQHRKRQASPDDE